ncbi:MAG: transposase [Bacteroidales bacterium]|nr:transposase [Bacteroidales bacterium]
MKFWLVTTEHLTDRLWFKDTDDFKKAMNIVAIIAATLPVSVIAFVLMSNHVHFVLGSDEKAAQEFITRFKKLYSQYFEKKYLSKELLRKNGVDIRPLTIGDESFEKAVAYTLMNPVAANICRHSFLYPWGTGELFFSEVKPKVTRVDSLSGRGLARILHSRADLPGKFLVDERGYINPSSYVPVKFVESVFATPKRMNYFLTNSSKARQINDLPSFPDQLVLSAIGSLCTSLFRKSSVSDLAEEQAAELFRQIRYRFSADPAQIARVAGITYDTVTKLLDSF